MAEVWKPIPGVPGYEASSEGRIRSLDRYAAYGRRPGHTKRVRGCVLRPFDNGRYFTVHVCDETRSVHQLVNLAFNGEAPDPDHETRHMNGESHDNRASNLEWGTKTENQYDSFRHGTACAGEQNYRAVLTEGIVRQIMELRSKLGPKAIAEALGIERHHVKSVIYGMSWNWLTGLPRRRYRKSSI